MAQRKFPHPELARAARLSKDALNSVQRRLALAPVSAPSGTARLSADDTT